MISVFRRFLPALVILATCFGGHALCEGKSWQNSITGSLPRVFELNEEGKRIGILEDLMVYRYYLPEDYDPSVKYPLVLFMHGSGESGRNNTSHVSNYLNEWINKTDSEYPAIFLAPQLLRSEGWGPGRSLDRTDEILDILLSDLSIDTNRLYLTGLSMGGFGTMEYLHHYNAYEQGTLRFAAAAPAAGAWIDPNVVEALRETPIWLAHGSSDGIVDPNSSRGTFNTLAGNASNALIDFNQTGAGGPMAEFGNVRYTEYPGVGHGSWGPFYDSPDLYEWMFSQSLVPEPSSLISAFVGVILATSRRWRACCLPRPRE